MRPTAEALSQTTAPTKPKVVRDRILTSSLPVGKLIAKCRHQALASIPIEIFNILGKKIGKRDRLGMRA